MSGLVFDEESYFGRRVPVMRWYGGRQLRVVVHGKPVSAGQPWVERWGDQVEGQVRAARRDVRRPDCTEASICALTVAFAVASRSDVDNLAKPVIDAVARGLFPENPRSDSCFSALLVHRMEDPHQADLGVAIRISRPRPRRRR